MDINTIVLIVILLVIVYAVTTQLQEKKSVVETSRQQKLIEKEELSKEDIATYGQVQERKGQLLNLIESNLADHPEESSQLKEIIEDWAELKIEAFHNRRSWVRATPSK
tara:strand:- start:37 stop:363 length:327 start_codon:yes stop_codon:yes gene_type:complete